MRDDPAVTDLVTKAREGDQQAWDALVELYAPLVWSICRRHQLGDTDAANVGQIVWLQLLDHLSSVPHPAALPDWLATTTRRECLRVLRAARGPQVAGYAPDADSTAGDQISTAEQELLLAERHAALREAMEHLPSCCRQLIALLIEDPPVPDAEISARLGIPIGSIGPNRGRCLDKLRDYPAVAALINADDRDRTSSDANEAVVQRLPSANGPRSATRPGNWQTQVQATACDPPIPPHPPDQDTASMQPDETRTHHVGEHEEQKVHYGRPERCTHIGPTPRISAGICAAARGLRLAGVSPSRVPARRAVDHLAYLCVVVVHGECSLMPHIARQLQHVRPGLDRRSAAR